MIADLLTILKKDLTLDLRRAENFIAMLFFSVIILLVFSFSLPPDEEAHQSLAPGVYWVTFLMSGMLGLSKNFQLEKEMGCMEALLIAPISRGAIFMGKMLGTLVFLLLMQMILIPVFSLLFYSPAMGFFFELLGLSAVTALGFASLGTLLSGLTTDVRFKEILLPILLFPLLVPLLLAAVQIMSGIFAGQGFQAELDWLKLLVGFDLIFLIAAYLTFDFVMEL
ncbi:MAG: heme exporter protein CcmB [bacterium]|nr:heme exporter protein CcmB [bacterium]